MTAGTGRQGTLKGIQKKNKGGWSKKYFKLSYNSWDKATSHHYTPSSQVKEGWKNTWTGEQGTQKGRKSKRK